ncbi:hypothetical protein AB6A40_004146 [Gnathostoma spinigerum]|uniref:RLR CTR domain-containing protein n=1 Tax=Gnathostoma spinigerum TaxID=75299 RepID=A0ABD6ELI7_9BILA
MLGRARARDSKSILLALDGAIEQRELENVQREALMRKCIMEIQSIPPDRMRQKIEEKIKFLRARREIALNEKNAKEASLSHNSYDISCRACGAFVTKSSDLRLMCNGQYVCCDPKIWERVNPVVRSDAKSISIATLVGKPICRGKDEFECGETLGTIVKLYGAYLPTLLARSVVVDDGCERSSVKAEKWEALMRDLFVVKAITERDLGLMMTSLYQHSPKVFLEMEIEAEKANKQALEWAKKEKKQRVFLPDE